MGLKICAEAYDETPTMAPTQDDIDGIVVPVHTGEPEVNEIESNVDSLEVGVEEFRKLDRIRKTVCKTDKLSKTAAELAFISVESIMEKLALPLEVSFVSLEHFDDRNTAEQATSISQENILETVKSVAKKIIDFVKMVWKKISDFIDGVFAKSELERKRRAQRVLDDHIAAMDKNRVPREITTRVYLEAFFTGESKITGKQILGRLENQEKFATFMVKTVPYFDGVLRSLEVSMNELRHILADMMRLHATHTDLLDNGESFGRFGNKAYDGFKQHLNAINDSSAARDRREQFAKAGMYEIAITNALLNSKRAYYYTKNEFEKDGWAPIFEGNIVADVVNQDLLETAYIVEPSKREMEQISKCQCTILDAIEDLAKSHTDDFKKRAERLISNMETILSYFKDTSNFHMGPNSPRQAQHELVMDVLKQRISYVSMFVKSYSSIFAKGINLLETGYNVTNNFIASVAPSDKK